MRILTIIDSLNLAGAEALVKDTVPRIVKRGVSVTVAVLKELPESPFEQQLRDEGVPFLPTASGGIYSPLHISSLAQQLGKFDLVHVRLFPASLWVPLARKLSGRRVPLVMSADTTEHNREKVPFDKHFERWMQAQYTAVVAASDGIAEHIRALVPNGTNRIRVVWNGTDLTRIENARPTNRRELFENDDPIVIYTARFDQQKDHATLIKALAAVKQVNALMVGDGWLRSDAEALVKGLKLGQRIRFLGRRPDVPELLKASDIYVHVPRYEGFGIAVIEAMAAGLPVIVSDVPGLSQVVGTSGVLVPPQNPPALAEALRQLLDSPERRKELAIKAKRRAADFDIEKTVDGYIAIYDDVLSGRIPSIDG